MRSSGPKAGRSPFGDLLVTLRTQRGLTQERLAQATEGDRISPRSITNYEHSAKHAKNWVLPHRTVLRLLSTAMDLDGVDRHALVTAWDRSRKLRDSIVNEEQLGDFVDAGREQVIQSIMNAWSKAQNGQPQFVFLSGGFGIGKTALVRHISDRIAASTNKVMISLGGAISWAAESEPYHAIRSATDRILEEPDTTSLLPGNYPSRPKLNSDNIERIVRSIPSLAHALISEHAIRSLAKNASDELATEIHNQLNARTSTDTSCRHDEYCRLIVHLSKSWPIVLILEDMQWASDSAAGLLLHLVQHLQEIHQAPILILCTYRNDIAPQSGKQSDLPLSRVLDTFSHAPHVHHVSLNDSMSESAGMAYIRGVIARRRMESTDNAEQLADWMYEQTSAHPLLTGEMMRHLVETKALTKQKNSNWHFNINDVPEHLPSSISLFIEQRLNRLERKARRILDVAATMDDVILTEIVAEIVEMDEEEVLDIIDDELSGAAQLLVPGTSLRLMQQSHTSYRFRHAIFREHIYNKIPKPRRRRLHLEIAKSLEEKYPDSDTTALADITNHYVLAEDWHSAQISGYMLAQHAVIQLDWDLSKVWFDQAEELSIKAQDPHQLWRTRSARLALLRGTGQHTEAIRLGNRIFDAEHINNSPSTLGLTYHHLGEVYYDLGKMETTIEYLERAIELYIQEDMLDLNAAAYAMLSHATNRQGKYDVALKHARKAFSLSNSSNNIWVKPEAVLAAANCEVELGYYDKAIESYQMSIELAQMSGRLNNRFIPPMNIGLCYVNLGEYQKAVELLQDLNEQITAISTLRLLAPPKLYLGYALEALGDLKQAAESYSESAEIRRTDPPPFTLYDSVAGQMRVALLQGDEESARNWLTEIITHLEQHGWEGIEEPLLVMKSVAEACRHFGDDTAYRSYIERAYSLMMKRAEMIESEEARTSYLSVVPINLKLQKLHAEFEN